MNRTTARTLAALAAMTLIGSLAACSDDPDPSHDGDMRVALGFLPNVDYAGNWVALEEGYYDGMGLSPEFLPGGPNSPAPEVSIASGDAEIAIESNALRMFEYLAENDDIVVIGQRRQESPIGLLSLAERPVRTTEELAGAGVIASTRTEPQVHGLMTINEVEDYTFVPGGADVGPLLESQGDALWAFATNQPLILETQFDMRAGEDYYFTPLSELGAYLMSDVYLVSRDYLENNRDNVVNFMAATIRGWQTQLDDPALGAGYAVDIYGAELGLDLEQQTASAEIDAQYTTSPLTEERGLMAVDVDFVEDSVYPTLEASGVSDLPVAADVIDTSIVEDAHALLADT